MEERQIAVIGGRDSVLGFLALGLAVFPAETADEARAALRRAAGEGCAVIYVTESLAAALEGDLARYRGTLAPAVIPIPGREGATGAAARGVRAAVQRAVGADLP